MWNLKCWKNFYFYNNYEFVNFKLISMIYKNLVFINRIKIKEDLKYIVYVIENKEVLNFLWNVKEYW